jgi:hypothetical protein
MTINKKLIFIIIAIIILGILISLGSYFGWKWYKISSQIPTQNKSQIMQYKDNETPKYWPSDLKLDQNMKTLSTIEITYSPDLVITKKTIESPYPSLPTFNFFKDYLNNNLWKITKEINDDNQIQKYLAAKREGYLVINIGPFHNNKTIAVLEYQYNPKNPMTPELQQEFGKLPPIFPEYLLPNNTKIGGYTEDQKGYYPILFSKDDIKSLYDYYLKTLKSNNWDILFSTSTNGFAEIQSQNKTTNKTLNIQINSEQSQRSIIINLQK